MTLRLIDGFDYIPALTTRVDEYMESGGWFFRQPNAIASNPGATPFNNLHWDSFVGRFDSGNCVGMIDEFSPIPGSGFIQNATALKPLPGGPFTEGYARAAMLIPTENTSYVVIGFTDAVEFLRNVSVTFHQNGVVKAWRGISTPGASPYYGEQELLGSSKAGVYYTDEWFQAEVHVVTDSTSGVVEVRINTQVVLSLLSKNTLQSGSTGFDAIEIGAEGYGSTIQNYTVNTSAAIYFMFDDVSFNDTAGSINNSYMGNNRVRTQFTSGAGANTDFTAFGAATNWEAAQNRDMDDTSYVYSGTVGEYDLYAMQAIVSAPYAQGIQSRIGARVDDATQRTLHSVTRTPLGTLIEGDDHYINQSFTYYTDITELNPDTGVQFTGAEVNSLQVGPKVEA